MADATGWFYEINGQQLGPVSPTELRALAGAGTITPETMVKKAGDAAWVRAGRVQGLFGAGSAPAALRADKPRSVIPLPVPPPLPLPLPPALPGGRRRMRVSRLAVALAAGGAVGILLAGMLLLRHGGKEAAPAQSQDQIAITSQAFKAPDGWRVVPPAARPVVAQGPPTKPPITSVARQEPPREDTFSPSELYKHVLPSVVRVNNYDGSGKLAAFGSGFLVSRNGHVATNLHVVQGAHDVTIRLHDGKMTPVRGVVGIDRDYDLAVLAIDGSEYEALPLSTQLPEVGMRVYAIGNPQGLADTLSEGIVSGVLKTDEVRFIQTTAAISPGSSGGPLLSSAGVVVGITSASLREGQSLNLAVPANALRNLLNKTRPPISLAQLNAAIGDDQHQRATIEDDPNALATAWKAIRARNYGEALRTLEQVPDTRRGLGFWMAAGHVHFALENFGEARAAFAKAIAIDGNSAEALLMLALAYRLSGFRDFADPNESWNTTNVLCRRVLAIDPTNAEANCILGITCVSADQAIGFLKTAATLDPKNFAAQYNLGLSLLHNHRYEEAIRPLSAALDLEKEANYRFVRSTLDDNRPESFTTTRSTQIMIKLALGRAYCESKQYESAVKAYKEILAVEPKNQLAPLGLCYAYRGWRQDFKHPDALYWEKAAEAARGLSDKGILLLHEVMCDFPEAVNDRVSGSHDPTERKRPEAERDTQKAVEKQQIADEAARWREWAKADGTAIGKARFSGMIAGNVKLKRENGEVVSIALDDLSKGDQAWVRSRAPRGH